MNVIKTALDGVLILEPKVFGDQRGYFLESWNRQRYEEVGIKADFCQDNESFSSFGVLRGLHFQAAPYTQAKLVRVIQGRVLDVALDIRKNSPTFGEHVAVELSGENQRQLWVPRGFAHGFVVLSETVLFSYKCDNLYMPSHERGVLFDDPALQIDWRLKLDEFILSAKDKILPKLQEAEVFDLNNPEYLV